MGTASSTAASAGIRSAFIFTNLFACASCVAAFAMKIGAIEFASFVARTWAWKVAARAVRRWEGNTNFFKSTCPCSAKAFPVPADCATFAHRKRCFVADAPSKEALFFSEAEHSLYATSAFIC